MSVERFVEQFGNVILECPVGASKEQMTVAEFSELEIGQKLIGGMATSHALLAESGIGGEQALTIVAGAALVRDEQENIIGLHSSKEAPEMLEPKKKLMSPGLQTN
jgi:hypothetical protein